MSVKQLLAQRRRGRPVQQGDNQELPPNVMGEGPAQGDEPRIRRERSFFLGARECGAPVLSWNTFRADDGTKRSWFVIASDPRSEWNFDEIRHNSVRFPPESEGKKLEKCRRAFLAPNKKGNDGKSQIRKRRATRHKQELPSNVTGEAH